MAKTDSRYGLTFGSTDHCCRCNVPTPVDIPPNHYDSYLREKQRREKAEVQIEHLLDERDVVKATALGVEEWGFADG